MPSNAAYPKDGGVFPNIFMPSNELQFMNAAMPIDVIIAGTSINDVNDMQSLNMPLGNSVRVNPDGKLAVCNDEQPLNTESFIISTVFGSIIDFKDTQL